MILLDHGGAARGTGAVFAPPAALEPFIEHAFVQRDPHDGRVSSWRVVPDAHATILVAVPRDGCSSPVRAAIVGARTRYHDIDVSGRELTCGLRLQIGALPAITGFPAGDFVDRSVPLSALPGAAAKDLTARLDGLRQSDAILRALLEFIAHSARNRRPRFHHEVYSGAASVRQLATRVRSPSRTTYARFVAEVGIPPRRFLSIERLERALRAHAKTASWSRAAAAAGFADHSHFTRDARRLLGETPTQWSRRGVLAGAFLPIRSSRSPD